MFWPDPTHQPTQPPTHPPNHTPTHGWGILHRFQIFKRNWNILISSSVIEFLLILRVHPLGGGGWVHGGGDGYGYVGGCPMHTHMHTHTCTHTHTCMLNMLIMLNMDASMSAAICNFYTCIHVCMCVCVHARACACVGGHPPMPPDAPDTPAPTCPLPRATGSPKQQNSISPELIEII